MKKIDSMSFFDIPDELLDIDKRNPFRKTAIAKCESELNTATEVVTAVAIKVAVLSVAASASSGPTSFVKH